MYVWLLVIIYLTFISFGLPDGVLGAAWPAIWKDLDSSLSVVGIISMIISVGTVISSLLSGYLLKHFSTGVLALVSCILTAGSLFGMSFAPSVVWFFVLALPLGLGGGAIDSVMNHYVSENYKAHHMNWLHCFWGVGATAGPLIIAQYMSEPFAWREGYQTIGFMQLTIVIILLVTLPIWKFAKSKQPNLQNQSASVSSTKGIGKSVFKLKGVTYSLVAFLVYCGAESLVGIWGASYLVNARGLVEESAANWISIYFVGIALGRLITGFISFKLSNATIIKIGQYTALIGGILILLPIPITLSLIGLLLVGLGFAPIFPTLLHETPRRFGHEHSA